MCTFCYAFDVNSFTWERDLSLDCALNTLCKNSIKYWRVEKEYALSETPEIYYALKNRRNVSFNDIHNNKISAEYIVLNLYDYKNSCKPW